MGEARSSQLENPPVANSAPSGSQGAKGVLAAVADVQEAVLILVLQVLRYGTERGVGVERGGVTRATSRYTGSNAAAHHVADQRARGW